MSRLRSYSLWLFLLAVSFGPFLLVTPVKAAYSDLPQYLVGEPYQYVNIGNTYNGVGGYGGNVPDAYTKVYAPNSVVEGAGSITIPIESVDINGNNKDCMPEAAVHFINYQVLELTADEGVDPTSTGHSGTVNVPAYRLCETNNITIDKTLFTESARGEHTGYSTLVIRFSIGKIEGDTNTYSNFLVVNGGPTSNPNIRLGYWGGGYAAKYPYPETSTYHPGPYTLSWKFAPPCSIPIGSETLSWGETDQGTSAQSAPGFKIEIFETSPSGVRTSIADLTGGSAATGRFENWTPQQARADGWRTGYKYEVVMTNVSPGNGIWVLLPFDSGDFNFGCPKPFNTQGNTSVSIGSGSNEENPTSITATGTIQEQRPAGGTEAPVKTATLKLFRNGAEIASTTDNSFQWVGSPSKTLSLPYTFSAGSARAQGWQAGDRICSILTWSHNRGTVVEGDAISAVDIADSDDDPSLGPGHGRATGGCITITNKPYVSVYGNDVSAGGGINRQVAGVAACDDQGKNNISANSRNAGSGTQLAAFAPGTIGGSPIGGFKSIFLKSSSTPSTPNGLTFGNESPTLGGYKEVDCSTDFYTEDQYPDGDSRKEARNNGTLNINAASFMGDGKQTVVTPGPGLLRLMNPASEKVSVHHSVFVNGDVYITHNITYAFNNATGDGWTDIASIPFFNLVVKGNIYIDPSVTQLDGRYIAQPKDDGSGGQIYTCAPGGVPPTNLWVQCGGQAYQNNPSNMANVRLTVNGQFIARSIRFLRTAATISNGVSGESAANSRAAEVFNFSPEMYLAQPAVRPKATSTGGPEQSISTLPPIL